MKEIVGGGGKSVGGPSSLSKAAAPVASLNLTETELSEFRDIFNLIDRDGGGTISKEELRDLLETLNIKARPVSICLCVCVFLSLIKEKIARGLHHLPACKSPCRVSNANHGCYCIPQEEVDLMIQEIDVNGNDDIDFDEFVAVMSRKVNTSYSADQVKAAFGVFEAQTHPGHVRRETLTKALMTYGSDRLTEGQARDLVNQLEADEHGLVNYKDFVEMMMS